MRREAATPSTLKEGLSKSEIARRLDISRDTIHRLIRSGQLDRDLDAEPVRYKPRPPVVTKLGPYRALIVARVEAYPRLSSVRLLEEVRAAGYAGGYTQVKEFVRAMRPREEPESVVRFETPAGLQSQVDFGEFKFPWGKRYAPVVVLGYSRLLWLRFYERQDMRTLFRGLEEAFAFFGGVPRELLFDQMKAVITRDLRLLGGHLVINEEFLRFAAHWGFKARACRAYRAKTKGKVERPISYTRGNFVYGREFLGDEHLDAERQRWLTGTAKGGTVDGRWQRTSRWGCDSVKIQGCRRIVVSPRRIVWGSGCGSSPRRTPHRPASPVAMPRRTRGGASHPGDAARPLSRSGRRMRATFARATSAPGRPPGRARWGTRPPAWGRPRRCCPPPCPRGRGACRRWSRPG